MDCRKWALGLCIAASCAGCVTETKTVPVSAESMAKLKDVKEAEFAKREATPQTWVAVGRMHEARASDPKTGKVEQNQWRDEARKAYQKAIELDPKKPETHIALANLYVKLEDNERAVEVYQKALKVNATAAALWYELGDIHLRRKDFNAAVKCLGKAHELDPQNQLVARQYGLCLARAGNPQQAVVVLCRVMNRAEANFTVARMMEHIGQRDLSKQYVQAALQERPTHPGAQQLMASLNGPATVRPPAVANSNATVDPRVTQAGYRQP